MEIDHFYQLLISRTDNSFPLMVGSLFLARLGLFAVAIPLISLAYGLTKGRYNYKISRQTLYFEDLPWEFDGLRIVQVSDFHLGSFGNNYKDVEKGLEMINELEGDLLFMTGDLINARADETEGWEKAFQSLNARYGKFAVLGNHDYGHYARWESRQELNGHMDKLMAFYESTGFRLLLNETASIEKEGTYIDVVGVENWGQPPFMQYGDLNKALEGTRPGSFKLLLSHDPSHWDAEVLHQSDIHLTFSGHTHGSQFGVKLGNKKWSPIQVKYPRWSGLYRENNQYLYVNSGFGFHEYTGRIGMPPEITLIELKKAS